VKKSGSQEQSMTHKEHLLVLTLFTKQNQFIRVLLDILKSRGILAADDARAFEFSQNVDASSNAAIFAEAKAKYLELARGLGIETGLENLPPASAEHFRPTKP
jgi:hypothetical protein